MKILDIPSLATTWSAPTRVQTSTGPREVRGGSQTQTFWRLWQTDREALRASDVSCRKDDNCRWQVVWKQIPQEEADKRNTTAAASRATTATISVPAPEGLYYRPFQLAGIEFALDHVLGGVSTDRRQADRTDTHKRLQATKAVTSNRPDTDKPLQFG